jgi:Flp pilus assembly CpaF family ATPase
MITQAERDHITRSLREDVGPDVLALLADPQVIDVHANPDGWVWIDTLKGRKSTDIHLTSERIEETVRHVASFHNRVCNEDFPSLRAVFPLGGERFQGGVPPIAAPHFTIRSICNSHSRASIGAAGTLTQAQADIIFAMLRARKNVIFAGMTLSGKTVIVDSFLGEYPTIFGPCVRVVVIETRGS